MEHGTRRREMEGMRARQHEGTMVQQYESMKVLIVLRVLFY